MTSVTELFIDRFGSDLRSVGSYDSDGGEFLYVRDDINEAYENSDRDRVIEEIRLEAIERTHQESLYAHGDLQCTLRCFEDATELHFIQDETAGVVVAVDGGAIDDLRGTVDACMDVIDGE